MGTLLALFFLSGAGAVAVETTWLRWLRLLLGATAPAASATLVAFFAGHALGAAWAARRSAGWQRPLAVYGRLELAGAVAAAAVPLALWAGEWILGPFYDGLRQHPAWLLAARLALALAATAPAAFCFGATFPAIAQAAAPALSQLGTRAPALHAANTLGAALAAALASFWLPGAIGVRAGYALALACLAAAAAAALLLDRKATATSAPRQPSACEEAASEREAFARSLQASEASAQPASERSERAASRRRAKVTSWAGERRSPAGQASEVNRRAPAQQPDRAGGPTPRALLLLALLSGLAPFATQVLLVQAFAQVLNQSTWAFGAVLTVVLLAIVAASSAVASIARRAAASLSGVLVAATGAAALAAFAFPSWLARVTGGLEYVGAAAPGLPYLAAALGTVALTAGPLLLAGSCVLPLTMALAAGSWTRARAGSVVGRLVAANTAGAIAGALAAPFLLLPALGPWLSFAAVAALWAAATLVLPGSGGARAGRAVALAAGALVVLAVANPLALPAARSAAGERTLAIDSSAAGVVAVVERDGERLIRVDGHYALGGTSERVHHERQAHLPLLLAPGARRVAHVGSATGISAGAALAHPIASLTLVELIPAVARAGARHFGDANRGVYHDPRTEVVVDDARNFLRATRARFDVVIADLFVPWHAGAGSLYTREHFKAVRERLEPGGLFCQWLPLYQLSEAELRVIAATFLDVFPRAAWFRGDFYGRFPIVALVGFAGDPPAPEAVSQAAEALARAGERDRWVTHPLGPWALYLAPLGPSAASLAGAPRNHDDRPYVEQLAAAGHAGAERGKVEPLVGLGWVVFAERLRSAARRSGDPLWPALPDDARRAGDGGALLQRAGALYAAGRVGAAAEAFAAAAARLPRDLVAAAPPDPTAAELWSAE